MEGVQPTPTPAVLAGAPQKPFLTLTQKQALIDNLQLEITERARRLRAKYALDAQSLRSRLERRIRAIPQALRATNIGDLVNKYDPSNKPSNATSSTTNTAKATSTKPSSREPLKAVANAGPLMDRALPSLPTRASPSPQVRRIRGGKYGGEVVVSIDAEDAEPPAAAKTTSRGTKRSSAEMSVDKENVYADLSLPKKRTKVNDTDDITSKSLPPAPPQANGGRTTKANTRATRTASRKEKVPPKILSPRSHNSRTPPPRSPSKPLPRQPTISRPGSPLKQFANAITSVAAAATTKKVSSTAQKSTTTTATAARGFVAVGGEKAPSRTRAASNKASTTTTATTATTASSARSRRGVAATASTAVGTSTASTRKTTQRTVAATNTTVSYPRVPSAASTASSTASTGTTIVRGARSAKSGAGAGAGAGAGNTGRSVGRAIAGKVASAVAGRKGAGAGTGAGAGSRAVGTARGMSMAASAGVTKKVAGGAAGGNGGRVARGGGRGGVAATSGAGAGVGRVLRARK